jgi:hypothetical protein
MENPVIAKIFAKCDTAINKTICGTLLILAILLYVHRVEAAVTSAPTTQTASSIVWDFTKSKSILIVGKMANPPLDLAGGLVGHDMDLRRYITIKLPGGRTVDEYWDSANIFERGGIIESIALYSRAQSIAEEHEQVKRLCTVFNCDMVTQVPAIGLSIEDWFQAAAGHAHQFIFGDQTFSLMIKDPKWGGGESVALQWRPNVAWPDTPCALLMGVKLPD